MEILNELKRNEELTDDVFSVRIYKDCDYSNHRRIQVDEELFMYLVINSNDYKNTMMKFQRIEITQFNLLLRNNKIEKLKEKIKEKMLYNIVLKHSYIT